MVKDLERYIRQNSAFDPTDVFGKGRIRKLIFEYDDLKRRAQREIKTYKETMVSQANAVTLMVGKVEALEKENAYLKSYIRESDAAKINLQQNRIAAESKKTTAEQQVEALTDENVKLKAELSILREDYRELSDLHEELLKRIKRDGINCVIDDLMKEDIA